MRIDSDIFKIDARRPIVYRLSTALCRPEFFKCRIRRIALVNLFRIFGFRVFHFRKRFFIRFICGDNRTLSGRRFFKTFGNACRHITRIRKRKKLCIEFEFFRRIVFLFKGTRKHSVQFRRRFLSRRIIGLQKESRRGIGRIRFHLQVGSIAFDKHFPYRFLFFSRRKYRRMQISVF